MTKNRGIFQYRMVIGVGILCTATGCNFDRSASTHSTLSQAQASATQSTAPAPFVVGPTAPSAPSAPRAPSAPAAPSPSVTPAPFVVGPGPAPASAPAADPFMVVDSSVGNGTIIVRLTQMVKGAGGANLQACTGALSGYAATCTSASSFVLLRNQAGWSYNSSTDTYSYDQDVSASGFPDTTYFAKYILPNGSTREVTVKALSVNDTSTSNGSVVTHLVQSVRGVGNGGIRACTGTVAQLNSACVRDSDFVYLANQHLWHYDQSTDTYSVNADVTASAFPSTTYFSRYILPDGRRYLATFTPKVVQVAAAPAPVSHGCSWTSWSFGAPNNPPAASCSAANAGAQALDGNGVNQTCLCN